MGNAKLKDTMIHNNILYLKVLCQGSTTKHKYEGGPVGGTIYISYLNAPAYHFGWNGEWYETFAEAADVQQARCRNQYEQHKKWVEAYENQLKVETANNSK